MKLCKDCKHYGMLTEIGNTHGCAKKISRTNYINGTIMYLHAQYVREDESACGPEGLWWEAREDLIR